VIGRDDLLDDLRFCDHSSRAVHIDAVYEFVAEVMATRSTAEWTTLLQQADIPNMPMHSIDSLIEDPHLHAIGYFPEYEHPSEGTIRMTAPVGEWSKSPPSIRTMAARLGEHSREILAGLGYDEAAIDALIAQGVTAVAAG
jgi:crotonobetainyl-CoA:carnitine CoA-transferase CaiB-like acyl-CoA transferase